MRLINLKALFGKSILLMVALLLTSCFGRLPDDTSQKIDTKKYGLDGSRPALIVFGAAWCKPCMAEIPALNRAVKELGSDLQLVTYLVEGPQKGVAITASDAAKYQSPKGEKPEYVVSLDPNWQLFDLLKPPAGHALPTLVFVNWNQNIERIVQKSMEYNSELRPALKALIAGKPQEPQRPTDPGQDEIVTKTVSFNEWSAMPGNEPENVIYQNFEAAWRKGLDDYSFLEDDMPFDAAKITIAVHSDGKIDTQTGVWTAFLTGCQLTVHTNPDGSYKSSEGICR